MMRRRSLVALAGAALPLPAVAQAWPGKPVRFFVGFAAGGTIDIAARLLGEKLSPGWGQPIVIENRAGAGGTIAGQAVARAEPDGTTLLVSSAAEVVVAPYTQAGLAYNPRTDLTPISLIARNPFALVVTESLPARTLDELIALSKRQPLSYASSGVGTTTHFVTELFKLRTGTDIEHVPYRGTAQLQADLAAGRVQIAFDAVSAVLPQVQAGRLRAIGVATATRSPQAPDIPTLAELGLAGFVGGGWAGFLGPAGLPAPIATRLETDVRAAMAAGVGEELAKRGFDPIGSTSAEFRAFIEEETVRWGEVARAAGIRPT
ncbi:Bug family tripartite tricarboxylate transporter substrate binding protein [Falsiroseomonas sp. HW251]|uniref:Bug family tripartite tricarboxylate transporter substrate binding protein n=1 Tax=Falsiroseomonas sp. HW251 TaxID=3390998 RepID=UPI003D3206E2